MPEPFKICPGCRARWPERADLLGDPTVAVVGYQVDYASPADGLFLFNHACGDTMAIAVAAFLDLAERPLHRPSLAGTASCEGHCLHRSDLDPCRAFCECAFVRDVLQIVRAWPKELPPIPSPAGTETDRNGPKRTGTEKARTDTDTPVS